LLYNTIVKTSRQRLLAYIKTHRAVTAAEIAKALHMTQANARHHLDILIEQGAVRVIGQRTAPGKGRPARVFALSEHSLGENLNLLASLLLQIMAEDYTHDQLSRRLKQLAIKLAKEPGSIAPGQHCNLSQRLVYAVQTMNTLNYQARWEAHIHMPLVILQHCPYASIIKDHPELCQVDAYLLEELLLTPVEQTEKLSRDILGAPVCKFYISLPTN